MLPISDESPDGYARHTRLWKRGNGLGTAEQLYEREGAVGLSLMMHGQAA